MRRILALTALLLACTKPGADQGPAARKVDGDREERSPEISVAGT